MVPSPKADVHQFTLSLQDPFQNYPTFFAYVFQVVCFQRVLLTLNRNFAVRWGRIHCDHGLVTPLTTHLLKISVDGGKFPQAAKTNAAPRPQKSAALSLEWVIRAGIAQAV